MASRTWHPARGGSGHRGSPATRDAPQGAHLLAVPRGVRADDGRRPDLRGLSRRPVAAVRQAADRIGHRSCDRRRRRGRRRDLLHASRHHDPGRDRQHRDAGAGPIWRLRRLERPMVGPGGPSARSEPVRCQRARSRYGEELRGDHSAVPHRAVPRDRVSDAHARPARRRAPRSRTARSRSRDIRRMRVASS